VRPLLAALLVLAAGCGTRKCKSGTAYVTLNFDAATSAADSLDVSLSVDGAAPQEKVVPRRGSGSHATLEIDFDRGYPGRSSLDVTVTASAGGVVLGAGHDTHALDAGCSAFTIAIAGGALPDLSVPISTDEGAPLDAIFADTAISDALVDQATKPPPADLYVYQDLIPPPATTSYRFPSLPACCSQTAYPRAVDFTFASLVPSTIYYTLDGTAPTLGSTHGDSPLTLNLGNGVIIRWFSYDGTAEAAPTFAMTTETPPGAAYVIEHVSLNNGGPIAVVSAGSTVNVALDLQVWGATGTGGQVTYAIDTISIACMYSGALTVYPSDTSHGNGHYTFTLTAPAKGAPPSDTHMIRTGLLQQADCTHAVNLNLTTNDPVQGMIVVR
jgi:hypothetical protein